MHHIDLDIIVLAVAVGPVAEQRHLTAEQLYSHLRTLRPDAPERLLRGACALAAPARSPLMGVAG